MAGLLLPCCVVEYSSCCMAGLLLPCCVVEYSSCCVEYSSCCMAGLLLPSCVEYSSCCVVGLLLPCCVVEYSSCVFEYSSCCMAGLLLPCCKSAECVPSCVSMPGYSCSKDASVLDNNWSISLPLITALSRNDATARENFEADLRSFLEVSTKALKVSALHRFWRAVLCSGVGTLALVLQAHSTGAPITGLSLLSDGSAAISMVYPPRDDMGSL